MPLLFAGLQHYGADPSWIQGVAATPFTPNKTIEQYEQIPSPAASASLHTFTAKELAAFRGKIIDGSSVCIGISATMLVVLLAASWAVCCCLWLL
jgi:hypothetical protein